MEVGDIVRIDNDQFTNDEDVVRFVANGWLGAIKEINDNDTALVCIPKSINGVDTRFGDLSNKDVSVPVAAIEVVNTIYKNIRS